MPARRSIALRLPLLILALLSAVMSGLGWSTYRHLTTALQRTATERLMGASTQIIGMLQGSIARVEKDASDVATDPAVVAAVARGTRAALDAAWPVLANQTAVAERLTRTLWSRDCRPLLTVGHATSRSMSDCSRLTTSLPAGAGRAGSRVRVQAFVANGDTVSYDDVSAILASSGDTLGYLQTTHTLRRNESARVIGRLIGRDVDFMLGNSSGPALWTDLTQRVQGPPLSPNHRGPFEYVNDDQGAQLGVARPMPGTPWIIWLQLPKSQVLRPAVQTMRELGLIALTALLLAMMGAWIVSRHVTTPLLELTDAAGDLADGNYGRRVSSDRRDELGVLVRAFNRMASEVQHSHAVLQEQAVELEVHVEQSQDLAHELEVSNQELSEALDEAIKARQETTLAESAQKDLEEQFLQAQKMEAVGRLAGGIAHDFNNLLTVISSYSTLALGSLRPEDPLYEDMGEIKSAAERAARLTRQLLAFSRKQVMRPQPLDLSGMARDMERMLQRLIGEDVTLELALDPEVGLVSADPGQIEQVIMNLVVNARDAMPNGGHLVIETSNVAFSTERSLTEIGSPAGEYVMLTVTDTGTGMSDETQASLFEPFFTTKGAGRGTGLGLSTVYGIVKQSGGDIHVRSELGRGTSFRIYFPRMEEELERHTREMPVVQSTLAGSETILLVEDDESLRSLTARVLRDAGYTVLDTRTPTEAVLIGGHHEGSVDLLLTDVVMPEMTGRTVAELLTKQRPGLRVLYMSGYTDDDVVRRGILTTATEFLQKPFTPAELLHHVRAVLDEPPSAVRI